MDKMFVKFIVAGALLGGAIHTLFFQKDETSVNKNVNKKAKKPLTTEKDTDNSNIDANNLKPGEKHQIAAELEEQEIKPKKAVKKKDKNPENSQPLKQE